MSSDILASSGKRIALSILTVSVLFVRSADAQDCIQYFATQFSLAKISAADCGVSSDLLGFVEDPSPSPGLCMGGAENVELRLGASAPCAAVWFCAAERYRCAMKAVSDGADCKSAMQTCSKQNPIPGTQ
jgi:hypothetical protein